MVIKRRRFNQTQTLEGRLAEEVKRLREEAKLLPHGAVREATILRARQAEVGSHMSEWFRSPGLIATGIHSPWARRRKVDLVELASAQWILTAPHTWVYVSVARAFAARELPMPPISLAAPSALLRVHLLATGPFVTAVPGSVLRMGAARRSLKQLKLGADLNIAGYPLAILTLKNRSLSPLVALFIDHVRQSAKAITH